MTTRSLRLLLLTSFALLATASAASAAPADLDPSFGSGGVVSLPVVQNSTDIHQTTQADGRVVFGYEREVDSIPELLRINTNGSVDATFGAGGKFSLPLAGGTAAYVSSVVALPSGRILVGGTTTIAAVNRMIVWAVTPAGTLDTTFNGGVGYRVLTAVGTDGNRTNAIGVQPDGDIAMIGSVTIGGIDGVVLQFVTGAGVAGLNATKVLSDDMGATSVAIQPNGDVVFGGWAQSPSGTIGYAQRFTAAGVWDNTFGGSGFAPFAIAIPIVSVVSSVEARPDGSVVSLGHLGFAATIQSLLPSGAASTALDPYGLTRVLGPNSVSIFSDGAFAAGGRLFTAGITTNLASVNAPYVARFDASGALDPTFASGAIAGIPEKISAPAAAVQPDGHYLVSYLLNTTGELRVARLMGDFIAPPVSTPLKVSFKSVKSQRATKFKKFSGTASGTGLAKVQVAIQRIDSSLLKKSKKCAFVKNSSGATKNYKVVKGKCTPTAFLTAKGSASWSYSLKKTLPPGKYKLYARAVGAAGAKSSLVSKSLTLKKK